MSEYALYTSRIQKERDNQENRKNWTDITLERKLEQPINLRQWITTSVFKKMNITIIMTYQFLKTDDINFQPVYEVALIIGTITLEKSLGKKTHTHPILSMFT